MREWQSQAIVFILIVLAIAAYWYIFIRPYD